MNRKPKPKWFCFITLVSLLTMLMAGLSGDTAVAVSTLGSWLVFKEFSK